MPAVEQTWWTRERPILRAIRVAEEAETEIAAAARAAVPDLDDAAYVRTIRALSEDGCIEATLEQRGDGSYQLYGIGGLTPQGRRVIGQWPGRGVAEPRAQRLWLLNRLYEECQGSTRYQLNMEMVAAQEGWPLYEAEDVARYLEEEGLIQYWREGGGGGAILLTHEGIKEMERSLGHPDEATDYFPAVVSVVQNFHAPVVASQIQGGTVNSHQEVSVTGPLDIEAIAALVKGFRSVLAELDGEDQKAAEAELLTIEAQLQSPRPNHRVIQAAVHSLVAVAQGVAGNAAFAGILAAAQHIHL